MTQKEYNEEIEKYKKEIEELKIKLNNEMGKNCKYEEILEQYYIVNRQLKEEQFNNDKNIMTIEEQRKIIEKYEKILDKFTINYN